MVNIGDVILNCCNEMGELFLSIVLIKSNQVKLDQTTSNQMMGKLTRQIAVVSADTAVEEQLYQIQPD